MGRNKGPATFESFAIQNLKAGEFFFTHRPDKSMTSWAVLHGRKITTERMIANPVKWDASLTCLLIKVTIVE
jgi:hypothetical protein